MKLEIKKKLLHRSDRVKCVDLHPTLPWVLISLYAGNVSIYDYNTQTQVRSLEITNAPVRSAKFIARKQWIIVGADDTKLRVFNYNTAEKIKTIEEHADYIRNVVVHPTLPYVLSCADDDSIKMFDWDKNWAKVNTFQDHEHYIMQLAINPKDPNMFASASLDRTIKIWTVGTTKSTANYTLLGHDSGVNCVDFCRDPERPHLVSGADDGIVKVWDYQTRQCLITIDMDQGGHQENVASVLFHPEIPIIMTAGEDDVINVWNSSTYKQITQLQYGLKRVWTMSAVPDTGAVAFGFDEGTVVVKIGKELPLATFANGKVVWVKSGEIQTMNLKLLAGADETSKDGEIVKPQNVKELGQSETFAQTIKFAPSGRYFAVNGDSDFIVYSYPKFSNAAFGSGSDLVWSTFNASQTHAYAVRTENGTVKVSKNFVEYKGFKTNFENEGIFGGRLLAIKGKDFITFYDWEEFYVVRRIDVAQPIKNVYWSEDGSSVVLALEDSFYLLTFNPSEVETALAGGEATEEEEEDGYEVAFTFVDEFPEQIVSGLWVSSECFTFINSRGNISYLVGGRVMKLGNADKKQFILGYDGKQNKLYLVDKALNIFAHRLLLSVLKFQTHILNGETAKAKDLLTSIPESFHGKLAKFLETNGHKEMAYALTPDQDHKFELALSLKNINNAVVIAEKQQNSEKWRKVGDIALQAGQFSLAEQCFEKSQDFNSLLLFYSSYGDQEGLSKMAKAAEETGKFNVAFQAFFLLSDVDSCINVLLKAKRIAEAAIFARAHAPSKLPALITQWGDYLKQQGLQFQPDNVLQTQAAQFQDEIEKEKQLKEHLYSAPRKPAAEFEQAKEEYLNF